MKTYLCGLGCNLLIFFIFFTIKILICWAQQHQVDSNVNKININQSSNFSSNYYKSVFYYYEWSFVWKVGTDHFSIIADSYVNCVFVHYNSLFVTLILSTNPSFAASICWVDELISAWVSELYQGQGLSSMRTFSISAFHFIALSLFLAVLILSLWPLHCTVILLSPLPNFPSILSSILAFLWLMC